MESVYLWRDCEFRERRCLGLVLRERSIEFREINVGASNSLIFRHNINDMAFVFFTLRSYEDL